MPLIPDNLIGIFKKIADNLKGSAKRVFMGEVVSTYGYGVQLEAEAVLGWSRVIIRKGVHELKSGIECADNFQGRGRKKAEEKNPKLLEQIKQIAKDKDLFLYMVKSKTTSDCYVDVLEKCWKDISNTAGQGVKELVINLDNGPQQNSRRTQFMKRIQDFSNDSNLSITLAYYPPYHSKYNPIERPFGSLEKHWGGEILSTEEAVLGYAKTMKWAGKNPKVEVVDKVYEHGVKLTKKEMNELNAGFVRKSGIEKWFVQIRPRAG